MKFKFYDKVHEPRVLNFGIFRVGTYCGSRWYWKHSWQSYPIVRFINCGFSIGPILFWREPKK